MELLLGKRDPVHLDGLPLLRDVATTLPALPSAVTPPKLDPWGMMANDRLGDCVIAHIGHAEMVFANISSEPAIVPDDALAEKSYYKLSGGQDSGLVMSAAYVAWNKGRVFTKEDALGGFTALDHTKIEQIQEAVAFCGVAGLGIQCPQSAQQAAQQQIQTGQIVPWAYDPSSPIEGGHAILVVGYDGDGVWCVSWGMLVKVTYDFLAHLLDEAYCPLAIQFRKAGHGPLNIDYATLDAALNTIAA